MVIDFTQVLKEKNLHRGITLLNEMSKEDANDIINLIMSVVKTDIAIGLGLEDQKDDRKLVFFEEINEIYKKFYGGCFFCDLEEEDPDHICIIHHKKLVEFLTKREEQYAIRRQERGDD